MKWSFSKAVQQRSVPTANQSFSEAVGQRSGLSAKRSDSEAVQQQSGQIINQLNTSTMDVSIVILTLVFLAMFLVPFLTISIMQKVKEHKKRKETTPHKGA